MTRVLILGGAGMLGHKLWQRLRDRFDVSVTLRGEFPAYEHYGLFDSKRTISSVDADDFDSVIRAFNIVKPDVGINAIGIVKQSAAAKDPIPSIATNSLFPHRLSKLCRETNVRLIHIGTDCVFSGRKGMYTESDFADAEDLYGRTKYLGEIDGPTHVTLRTSIIGRELSGSYGLIEWFLSNRGRTVKGYRKAIFSGLTTAALAGVIGDVIEKHRSLTGMHHVSADPIDKNSLLQLVRDRMKLPIQIEASDDVVVDRSLDSRRFRSATGWKPASWPEMIGDLAADPTPYDRWREHK